VTTQPPNRPHTSAFVGVSLDGFLARPDGSLDWLTRFEGEDHGYEAFFSTVDTLVLGRATHDFVRALVDKGLPWPYQNKRCVVMTHQELAPAHGEWTFQGEPGALLAQLQDAGARHVYVDGGVVIRTFLAAGLLDTLIVSVVPCLLGAGLPLFGGVQNESGLALENVRSFKNGVAQLHYRVKTPA
jgi:dihydrofolate reductase